MSKNKYITIMAGGVGSRFWPASTEDTPKQFLDILGVGKSLLRLTFERFLNLVPAERILIVTNKKYKALTQFHLPELPEENILCEPSRNNTAPCVAYTALRLRAANPDAVFVTAPSDHIILKEEAFLQKITEAFEYVESNNAIVTLGIQPTRPDTGYGYIEVSNDESDVPNKIHKVSSFKEKPNKEVAQQYLDAGNYLWNGGIFIWKANDLIDSFRLNAPEIIEVLTQDESNFATDNEQKYIDKVYPNTPSISVDYAILERADNVFTISADIGWSDLGTWNSLHAFLDKDQNLSVTIGANTHLIDTKNTIVRSDSEKVVIIKGLDEYIVVDEPNALLIYPKGDEQEIKNVVKEFIRE
uniref:mannose-1-phosphate guanylyltransferase n=1 Tax=uncultured Sphingobacteriia bacterium TaxID=246143 RepID=F4MM69_9BACT|nr:mannose-1-phosphate guanylyltransferase [uncultured Sphingobacteriia bacterium]